MLSAIHGATAHVGNRPKESTEAEPEQVEQAESEISQLRQQLETAVSNEEYEQAAQLRDQFGRVFGAEFAF